MGANNSVCDRPIVEVVVQVCNRAKCQRRRRFWCKRREVVYRLEEMRERRESKEQTVPAELMELTDLNARVGLTKTNGASCQV